MSIESCVVSKTDKKIRTYRDLKIWNSGINLVKAIYNMTESFPSHEFYGIVSQMRRCSVSIPSNIAEGFRRIHNKEYKQFLYIALGSCAELETQLTIAKELKYIDPETEKILLEQTDSVCRMTMGLIKKL